MDLVNILWDRDEREDEYFNESSSTGKPTTLKYIYIIAFKNLGNNTIFVVSINYKIGTHSVRSQLHGNLKRPAVLGRLHPLVHPEVLLGPRVLQAETGVAVPLRHRLGDPVEEEAELVVAVPREVVVEPEQRLRVGDVGYDAGLDVRPRTAPVADVQEGELHPRFAVSAFGVVSV